MSKPGRRNRDDEKAGVVKQLTQLSVTALLNNKKGGVATSDLWPPEGILSVIIDCELIPRGSQRLLPIRKNLIAALSRAENGRLPVREVTFRKEGQAGVMTLTLDPAGRKAMCVDHLLNL